MTSKRYKKDLFFDRVAYEVPAIHADGNVPVSTAYVYHESTKDLLYVMEKIGKLWYYTKWSNIEKMVCGRSSTICDKCIEDDFLAWSSNARNIQYQLLDSPNFKVIGKIEWQGAPRRSDAYHFCYGVNPMSEFSNLVYVKELKNKLWSYSRWTGPHVPVGTIAECRDAIRADYLSKPSSGVQQDSDSNNTVTIRYTTTVAGIYYRSEQAETCALGQKVELMRDDLNPHDPNAIEVYADEMIGFIPRELAKKLAPYLDSGADTSAEIVDIRDYMGEVSSITIDIAILRSIP